MTPRALAALLGALPLPSLAAGGDPPAPPPEPPAPAPAPLAALAAGWPMAEARPNPGIALPPLDPPPLGDALCPWDDRDGPTCRGEGAGGA